MNEMITFIEARVDEDEARARRILSTVDARRSLLRRHAPVIDGSQSTWTWFEGSESESEEVLRSVATEYDYHPDYREDWRP